MGIVYALTIMSTTTNEIKTSNIITYKEWHVTKEYVKQISSDNYISPTQNSGEMKELLAA